MGSMRIGVENVLVAFAYWGISWVNFLVFHHIGFSPSPIWPAAALSLVAAFLRGWRIAPGIAIGALSANHFALGGSWAFASCIAITNTIGPLVGATLIHIYGSRQLRFKRLKDGIICFSAALFVPPIITALGGAGTALMLHLASAATVHWIFLKWATAHMLGIFFFATPVFVYLHGQANRASAPSAPDNRRIWKQAWVICVILTVFFWLAATAFNQLWFKSETDTGFLHALFPIEHTQDLCLRIFVVSTIIICTMVVAQSFLLLMKQKQAASQAANHLRITLNSIGDAVISTDTNGHVCEMNPVAEQLTGWGLADARGIHMTEVFHIVNALSREPAVNPVEKVLECGQIVGLANHTVLIARDGTEYQICDSAAPIRDEEGRIFGVILVFRDVTEEYALQEQLNHRHRMDVVGQLAGGIAHDFNNMLGGIMGAAELQQELSSGNPELEDLNRIILDSTKRAANLTGQLLTFSRRQQLSSSIINAVQSLSAAIDLLRTTTDPRVQIIENLLLASANVLGDTTQLQNAFLNLGLNATQAMPDGGTLTISTKETLLDSIYCHSSPFDLQAGPFLEVEMNDTGCGIETKNLSKIFEPFFTTKSQGKGTGLGLATVFGTIQQHKGAITVYSEVGAGTTFRIYLPLSSASQTIDVSPPLSAPACGNGRILVIDDEDVIRATAKGMLERLGYEVLLAENGKEGLEIFTREHEALDLVIVDMVMPKMNGRDCFAAMRHINPKAGIILASGFSQEQDVQTMKEQGLLGFIRKPYCLNDLGEIVAQSLRS
jgi:PAS domain S-box-containing protein